MYFFKTIFLFIVRKIQSKQIGDAKSLKINYIKNYVFAS